jgi:hypothetical protein
LTFFTDRSLPSAKPSQQEPEKNSKLITVRFHAATALFPFFPVSNQHATDEEAPFLLDFKKQKSVSETQNTTDYIITSCSTLQQSDIGLSIIGFASYLR